MPGIEHSYRLLDFDREAGRVSPYAHLYRFGQQEPPTAGPLVLHIGGSIEVKEYEARRRTRPDLLLEQFCAALQGMTHPPERVDLIVCPCPVDTGDDGPDWMVNHLDDDLTPALGHPPTSTGCIGHSAGGSSACHVGS